MESSSQREAKLLSLHACCFSTLHGVLEPEDTISKPTNTSANCRHSFRATTTTYFFPNTQFTNHECLPSLQESFFQFIKAYPQYSRTNRVDEIRAQEYCNLSLSNHVCLDYIGVGLFSYSQVEPQFSAASSKTPPGSEFPFFNITHKSVNLKAQLLHGRHGSEVESAMKRRIMDFLNITQNDYCVVFTANRSSAFKLVAESYPFQTSRKLLTVYDSESEALETMISTSEKRGARAMSAEFKSPRLRIHGPKLSKMIARKKKKKKNRGLFVFPLQSRMTGASYSYQWMSLAQENGWHVLLDACALGPKDMHSFGLSLIRPDFLICSFYKVFGENPTGFGCLVVKKSIVPILEACTSGGIVSLMPAKKIFLLPGDSSTDTDLEQMPGLGTIEDDLDTSNSFSGPIVVQHTETGKSTDVETSKIDHSEQCDSDNRVVTAPTTDAKFSTKRGTGIECRCLDHVDSLGLTLISSRTRYLINWLVSALMKLQHPNRLDNASLVKIYGPKIKFDRGPALAFNVYDWKGEKVEPVLVQKLADRSNIALSNGFLHNIWFSDKYQEEAQGVVEIRKSDGDKTEEVQSRKAKQGINVVTAALSFLVNFEDIHRLWTFIARFLDADFVEKERWRYTALNQKTVEV